jgi:hypothetical protein
MLHYARGLATSPPVIYKLIVGSAVRLPLYLSLLQSFINNRAPCCGAIGALPLAASHRCDYVFDNYLLGGTS